MPIWGWSSSQTCRIDWLSCTRHRCSSCTYSICDLCHHCYYDSRHCHHCRNRTEHHRKLGTLKHYYLDEFKQTGVFIRLKWGMQNSVAIKDRREGSLPNNQPLLPTTMSVIIPQLFWKGIRCCARLACLEVIVVPLRLMQLDEIGCDIHYQRLTNVFGHKGVPMIDMHITAMISRC